MSQESNRFENFTEQPATYKPPVRPATGRPITAVEDPVAESRSEDTSGVPLSVTVVIGCVLLFINLLIFAGLFYYHRKKVAKYREHPGNLSAVGDLHQIHDTRTNGERCNSRGNNAESVTLMQTQTEETAPKKVATINHKPVSSPQYTYTAISKPVPPPQGPGAYSYSALSQNTSSPMHSQNQIQTTSLSNPPVRDSGTSSEDGSHTSRGSNSKTTRNPSGSDQTAKTEQKVDPRTKHLVRGNHTVSSNNAITIV